ncbi:MAG: FKBP-type peptidyl-prolyl cis-trans isomerase [Balneolaceae bacterium]
MKTGLYLSLSLFLLLQIGCLDVNRSQAEPYDNSADIKFLEENKLRDDVSKTPSGLQYRVIREGEGQRPKPESTVRVHYTGTLIDGTVFDSSHNRGEPADFKVNRVIPGWTEGLQLMKEGSVYEFFIPAGLAYGNNPPTGSPIQPGMTLIFEVELLNILD